VGVSDRLKELGIDLPPTARPVASYVPVTRGGGLAFVAGQVPLEEGKPIVTGRLGESVSVEQGQDLARRCALQALAALNEELGSLDMVRRILKVTVWVASGDGFVEQPKVANGASDLLVEVFGEAGKHARAAVSAPSLPLGAPIEVELIADVS
jgi:enamine deaminase RidA (YjgF/YER057c/UK114 family)